jgi:ATP-binding cassette subfamily F protein 3
MREQEVRNYLGGFDFRGDKVHEPVETFSGGEKARLALALVAFAQPNLLLMDEPTNHLDMEMRQALTIALQEFEGAILLVSHDRHLLANTVDSFYLVEDNKIDVFDGDLESYRLKLLGENTARKSESESKPANRTESKIQSDEASVAARVPAAKVNHKQSRQIRTRIKTIEERIDRLKDKLEIVIAALSDNAIYEQSEVDNLQNLLRDQMGLKDEIETLEEEWFEKSEILEQS